ncbi:MAG: hypothetical protein EPN93_17360 [Spirochaetes bacterium]|nr:MAG: hypothetical protein EPN93_17360 [Spirochaetota bacterium]
MKEELGLGFEVQVRPGKYRPNKQTRGIGKVVYYRPGYCGVQFYDYPHVTDYIESELSEYHR